MDAMEALNIAVLTVSDTRTEETDRSGQSLVQRRMRRTATIARRILRS